MELNERQAVFNEIVRTAAKDLKLGYIVISGDAGNAESVIESNVNEPAFVTNVLRTAATQIEEAYLTSQ